MTMGRREVHQDSLLVPAIRGPSHIFYDELNAHLDEHGFDEKVEKLCEGFFEEKEKRGRPSIAPGMYFRMLLVGYFEGRHRVEMHRLALAESLPASRGHRASAGPFDVVANAAAAR